MRRHFEVRDALEQVQQAKRRLEEELSALRARVDSGQDDAGVRERLSNTERAIENKNIETAELEGELGQALGEAFRKGEVKTETAEFPGDSRQSREPVEHAQHTRERDGAMRTIERYRNVDTLSAPAADNLDTLVRGDRTGLDSRYLAAVGNPDYATAFAKVLAEPVQGHMRFSQAEHKAWQEVQATEQMRGLVAGTGSAGGFGLPIAVDPTILLSGPGVVADGVRQYSTVRTVNTHELRLVSSAGTAASYDAEASVVSDDTPTLAQPVITPAMARYFIPFSYEMGDDWSSLEGELLRLTTDARNVLDATMFLTGTGTDQPAGVLTGLSTTQRVLTTTTAVYALADPWLLKAALRPRDIPNATFAAAPGVWDITFRFVGGNSTEPLQFDAGRGGNFLGRPKFEWSTMVTTTTTTGSKIMLAGDFTSYVIADRVGMSAEILPALFDPTTARPTGQRGWFARWRTGAKVAVPEAFRYLEIK